MSDSDDVDDIDVRDFEFFRKNVQIRPFQRGRSHFSKIIRKDKYLIIHDDDYDSARRSYIRTSNDPNSRRATEVLNPTNSDGFPEFKLYGFTWIANEFDSINGHRIFVLSHKDRYKKVERLANR